MTTYTNVFGGTVVYSSDVSYRAVSLTANTQLSWPTELATNTNVVSQIMNVTATSGPWQLEMPEANDASVGETTLIFNVGSNAFTVTDAGGNTIVSIAPGLAYQIFLIDNTTANGTWSQVNYGAGTSSATAGSLAGAGIKAIGTSLNQSMSVTTFSVDYTFQVTPDRSNAFIWTGGAGTATLPLASNAGNDWFVHLRNNGTGAIALTPSGSDLINGSASLTFNPGDSAIVTCSGTGWFTIGFGQAAEFTFDYDSISLTGETSPYSLSGANLNRIAYNFGGTLLANMDIIVPTTIQQYWVTNSTAGGYDIVVKTLAGTGITVANGESAILYCNGTNVVDADSSGVAYPISVANGGTGATNATDARTNLSAAKSGVNGDITQITALADGGASGPAVTFASENNTGLFRVGAGSLGFSVSGTQEANLTASGFNLATGNAFSINTTSVLNATTLGSGVVNSSLTSVGTLTSGALGTGFTTVAVAQGGTGATTFTSNGILYGNGSSALGVTAAGTTGQVLVGNTGGAPSWAALSGIGVTSLSFGTTGLTPSAATQGAITVSGTLGVANGGTGATSLTSGYLVKGNGTSAVSASVVYDDGTNVGIGTSSPGYKLDVSGAARVNSASTPQLVVGDFVTVSTNADLYLRSTGLSRFLTASGGAFTWGASGGSETMRLDASGNLGVGTSSPGAKLDVNGSVRFVDSSAAGPDLEFGNIGGGTKINNVANSRNYYGAYEHVFTNYDNSTERMRLDASGNLGIGTSSPGYKLDIAGSDAAFRATSGNAYGDFTNGTATLRSQVSGAEGYFGTVNAGSLIFKTNNAERMRLDASGNLGLGATPSAWSGVTALQMASSSAIAFNNQYGEIESNAYYNGGYKYIGTGLAAKYAQSAGVHQWYTAPSGTAGNAISFTQAMTLDASGNLGIGTSSPAFTLDISQTAPRIRQTATTGTNSSLVQLANSGGNAYLGLDNSGGGLGGAYALNVWHSGAYPIVFATNNTERVRIDSSGNVGIGTTSPVRILSTRTSSTITARFESTSTDSIIELVNSGTNSTTRPSVGSFNTNMLFSTNGSERARIDSSGNLLVGTTSGSSKLTVAGTIESTTGGVKFPDATTQTTKGIAAAFTQITSTSASGTAVTFSNIPQTYTEIYAEITDVSHNGGTSQGLRIQVSTDGVTYTTALNVGPSVAAANSVAGIFSAFDYSRNYVEVSTGTISSANASPYAGFMDSPLLMKITGGIKYVSFVWSGGASFDAGTITLYGR